MIVGWGKQMRVNKPTGINRIVRRDRTKNPNISYQKNETVRKNYIRHMHLVEKIIGRPFDGKLTKQECKKCMDELKPGNK